MSKTLSSSEQVNLVHGDACCVGQLFFAEKKTLAMDIGGIINHLSDCFVFGLTPTAMRRLDDIGYLQQACSASLEQYDRDKNHHWIHEKDFARKSPCVAGALRWYMGRRRRVYIAVALYSN